ncbi:hypothetical protein PWG14_08270 (plasmid) [Chromobacterium amazonense]|uniref:hypothetical protein n=1 Tax=Chromobacterium amazonense TaxID=1382803 RepID=UPI00237DC1C7|nr:hypothetical protein [Chromobacterium amazonense]MDE1712679.1 hypothetical protein [Chromobacterium amazonense]
MIYKSAFRWKHESSRSNCAGDIRDSCSISTVLFLAGWLKYLIMFLGALALHAVWDLYAGTPVVEKERSQSLTFSEDDYKVGENDCSHWADIGIGMGVGRDD